MLLVLVLGCTAITGDFSTVVAIQYTGPSAPRVEEGDTVRLTAVALGIDGVPIANVPVIWRVLEVDPTAVGLTLDSLTGLVTATTPGGPWRVQGEADGLRTNPPIQVTVVAAPDTLVALDPPSVSTPVGVTESPAITAGVYDLTTTPGEQQPLANKRIVFRVVEPAAGSGAAAGLAIARAGSPPGTDSLVAEVLTSVSGLASLTARRVGPVQPDSAIIAAVALTARGDTVPGSPVQFVVFFEQN